MNNIAICCMVYKPINFDFWIYHHLDVIKINYILLRVENTQFSFNFENNKVIILEKENIDDSINSIYHQQFRQRDFVNRCLHLYSNHYNIKYLLHIDDDELLILHSKYNTIHDFLNYFYPSHSLFSHVRIQNFEAILLPNHKTSHCLFLQTLYFKDCSLEKCRSYSNGKSIALISDSISCTGCHTFSGPALHVSKHDIIILHFDSVLFQKWFEKFKHLSNISPSFFHQIPFPFYQKSILLIQNNSSTSSLYDFWISELSDCTNPIYIPSFYHFPYSNPSFLSNKGHLIN